MTETTKLHNVATITSEDFPEWVVTLRSPRKEEWDDFVSEQSRGNVEEAQLNLLIACGTVTRVDGGKAPIFGEVVDEWPSLPELAFAAASEMAGVFAVGVNAIALDLPAIVAAVEKHQAAESSGDYRTQAVKLTPEEDELMSLYAKFVLMGFTFEIMRTIIACNPRRGSYRAMYVSTLDAVFVVRKPRFPQWSAYNRKRRARKLFEASEDLSLACSEFPSSTPLADVISKRPGVAMTLAAEVMNLYGDTRAEVKKG